MGQPLFNVNISGLIKQFVRPLTTITLVKVTKGTRTSTAQAASTNPTSTNFICSGVVISQDRRARGDAAPVADGTRKILLIGDTIDSGNTFPEIGDRIIAEGKTFQVEVVTRDPAKATYTCTVRQR